VCSSDLGVLFLVHPLLGLIGAISALLMFGLGLAGDRLTAVPLARSVAALTRSQGWFGMAAANLHVIRAMGMLDGARRLIGQAAQDARNEQDVVQRRHETIMLISKPARALAQVLIMGTAAWLVLEQSRSPAIIFATSMLFGRALGPIEGAVAGWKALAIALSAYRRLDGIMSAATTVANGKELQDRPKGSLIVNNVGIAVVGSEHPVLRDVSFSLAPGECLGIIGPSGSGKSTLLNLMAGLDRPTSGAIHADGRNLAELSSLELARYRRNTVGMVFQSFNLLPRMTLAENVELPLRLAEVDHSERDARVSEALQRVKLEKRAGHRPAELSGGEQQRTAIARALVNRPKILFADEPTGNLDSATGESIMNLLIEIKETLGMTIIMVTHERPLAEKFASRLAVMGDGKLLSDGAIAGVKP